MAECQFQFVHILPVVLQLEVSPATGRAGMNKG